MTETIRCETLHDGAVIRLVLDKPKGNVLDGAMLERLGGALAAAGAARGVKLIEITSAGEHFSFGASVEEHVKEKAPEMLRRFHGLFRTALDVAVPTAALVSGRCLGGGMELALLCQFLFVDASALLGQPEIVLGLFAPPASLILPRKVGQARADDLLLTGRTIGADEAVAIGLATEKYADREAMEKGVDAWVRKRILPKSASSLRFAARAARHDLRPALDEGLGALERLYLDELMETADANEGIASFLERRKAEWKNA